jgi:hypothetical protein
MESSNFNFLEVNQSAWAQLAKQAEQYVYTDPQSAVVKLRCFTELAIFTPN